MNLNKSLTNWYSINKRDLPWRETQDPYQIWLSEVILQQTQVNQGLPYFERFINQFPTIFDLAKANESEILKAWQGLGYYSRARNLHFTAQYIVDELDGVFPDAFDDLIKLKGIGDYTASAIASICYDLPHAVVDGNVYRFLARFFGIHTPINSTQGFKEFKAIAQEIMPSKNCGMHNQAIMEFGARHCKPNSPFCTTCPFISNCMAYKNDEIEKLPVKLKKTKVKQRYFNYLVFLSNNQETILQKRHQKGIWQNLYEFPLIESKNELSLDELLKHSHLSDLGSIEKMKVSLYNEEMIIHKLSHQHIFTKFWIIEYDHLIGDTVKRDMIDTFPVSQLIANFIKEFEF